MMFNENHTKFAKSTKLSEIIKIIINNIFCQMQTTQDTVHVQLYM